MANVGCMMSDARCLISDVSFLCMHEVGYWTYQSLLINLCHEVRASKQFMQTKDPISDIIHLASEILHKTSAIIHKSSYIKTLIMDRKALQNRTKQFHIDVIKICETLPKNPAGYETAKQVIRSAGSVGANYRATVRAKSKTDFIYKIEIVLEEADESMYWLEVIRDSEMKTGEEIDRLIKEANELTAIFAATDKTAKNNRMN
jgi:four helix bundle protein